MKISHLFYVALLAMPLQMFAQYDDMYFASTKKKSTKKEVVSFDDIPNSPDYHTGALRSDDDYNRRNRNHVYGVVTEGQDTVYYTENELMGDSLNMYQDDTDDYAMSSRLARFHGGVSSPYYWDYYYDPYYDPWYYDPWYYDPWYGYHYGHYGYYGYSWYGPSWYGWGGPWYNSWHYGPYWHGGGYYGGFAHVGGGYYHGVTAWVMAQP